VGKIVGIEMGLWVEGIK